MRGKREKKKDVCIVFKGGGTHLDGEALGRGGHVHYRTESQSGVGNSTCEGGLSFQACGGEGSLCDKAFWNFPPFPLYSLNLILFFHQNTF